MIGEYRFMKTEKGGTKFAKIKMDLITSDHWEIKWGCKAYKDEIEVAETGINNAFKFLQKNGELKYTVTVFDFFTTMVDTTPDAIFCAAILAVLDAAGIYSDQFELIKNNDEWEVVFIESELE